jgi:tRNA (adenine37-N6)-methyltransferase
MKQAENNRTRVSSIVTLVAREGPVLHVRGLDCVDCTPLLDLKPDRSHFRADPSR